MTSRERLLAAFHSQPVDRVPVKVWGASPWREVWHPGFQPIMDAALERTDLAVQWSMDAGYYLTSPAAVDMRVEDRPSSHEDYLERHVTVCTPRGDLLSVVAYSPVHKPGRTIKYAIETVEDAHKFLSIPYVRMEPDLAEYFQRQKELGERGILIVQLDVEPIYAVQKLMGSETLAFWLLEERELVREMVERLAERMIDRVDYLLSHGAGPVFGYVGPELCIPPLARPEDFQEFVVDVDRRFTTLIKEAGGLLWVHCHGKMRRVLQGFMDIGVDCLNPIEPPPLGDVTLRQAREIVGRRLCLEGNLESDDLYRAPASRIRELVAQAVEEGRGGGLILCPSSGFMEWPTPRDRLVENYITYIDAALECGREIG
jgi:uroporphyrinogen-III decarboxylase